MAKLNKNNTKPRLENLDDMFHINTEDKNTIEYIDINKLTPFNGHPFCLYEGERLDDMIASIVSNGILVPILVRKTGKTLEILAGHNRVNAAKLAKFNEIPAIILKNISDEDAMAYVIETNLLQRSFSDMSHTEKAAVITMHHSKMFSQGKRNDILEQIKILENSHENTKSETCDQVGHKLKSRDIVANEYNLSKTTVARYLRIEKLIPALKTRLDNNDFAFISAVTLSFLSIEEQEILNDYIEHNDVTVDMKKADMLRKLSEEGNLNSESIYQILLGETVPKTNHIPTVKLSKTVYTKYFKPNQSTREIQDVVEKALELYFSQNR